MFVPSNYFSTIEAIASGALEEGNYYMGYKRIILAQTMDDDTRAEGLEIVRRSTNATKAIYRFLKDMETLEAQKTAEAQRQGLALRNDPKFKEEPEKVAAFDKEIRKVEHKILASAYDIALLRDPMDNFLYAADIPRRSKYNKKDKDDPDE